jgi:hypothetical protein
MSSVASVDDAVGVSPRERLEVLFGELSELAGQRNAIDARIVEIVAEIDHGGLWGNTGARSVAGLIGWKTGSSAVTAKAFATVAHRLAEFPRCAQMMRDGRLSLDQINVIAAGAGEGSDAHYAELAAVATVSQLRKAVSLEPRPAPDRREPERAITKYSIGAGHTRFQITLPDDEAAAVDAALQSHHDALIGEYQCARDNDDGDATAASDRLLPLPNQADAFMRLVETSWDAEVARRPHGARTTVVVHLDVKDRIAALHVGPVLADADRHYLTCDATCEVWFERDGQPIGAGRSTRTISRRLRRALEYRDRTCAVPGCSASRRLHAHHIFHWEDGGPTELSNLVLVCPYHHRLHHRGGITIVGPADTLTVFDDDGQPLHPGSLARPPTKPPPAVPPWNGPLGERAQWWWYNPYEPPPQSDN